MNGLLKIRMNVRRQDTKLVSTITSVVLLIVSLFSYDFENCIKRTKSLFGQLMRIALRELNLFLVNLWSYLRGKIFPIR